MPACSWRGWLANSMCASVIQRAGCDAAMQAWMHDAGPRSGGAMHGGWGVRLRRRRKNQQGGASQPGARWGTQRPCTTAGSSPEEQDTNQDLSSAFRGITGGCRHTASLWAAPPATPSPLGLAPCMHSNGGMQPCRCRMQCRVNAGLDTRRGPRPQLHRSNIRFLEQESVTAATAPQTARHAGTAGICSSHSSALAIFRHLQRRWGHRARAVDRRSCCGSLRVRRQRC